MCYWHGGKCPRIIHPARGGAGGLQLCDHQVTQAKPGPWASQCSGSNSLPMNSIMQLFSRTATAPLHTPPARDETNSRPCIKLLSHWHHKIGRWEVDDDAGKPQFQCPSANAINSSPERGRRPKASETNGERMLLHEAFPIREYSGSQVMHHGKIDIPQLGQVKAGSACRR